MSQKFVLSFLAKIDLEDTDSYYQHISENLTEMFWKQFDETINRIQENSLQFQVRYDNIRIAFFTSLPFGVHFEIDGNLIKIIRVLHTKRNF